MAYTTHGHHIPGTNTDSIYRKIARCGGPGLCNMCSQETAGFKLPDVPDGMTYHEFANSGRADEEMTKAEYIRLEALDNAVASWPGITAASTTTEAILDRAKEFEKFVRGTDGSE